MSFFLKFYADPKTFKVINEDYWEDKDNKYYRGVKY